ncbi:MAG: hypothetical protein O2820_05305 [Planctomycetota bacterium]|nr:hypothetical protein [Planctomycetota bacterium]MDA1248622.1 hypothetical protein [Planctomycetota bacterium]
MGTTLRTAADGFSIVGGNPVTVRWQDVVEIVAFKRDLLTRDLICVGFRVVGSEELIETDEEMPGFGKLRADVESRFSLPENWWSEVAFPAFATNMTTIWSAAS